MSDYSKQENSVLCSLCIREHCRALLVYVIGSLGMLLGKISALKFSMVGKIMQAVASMICRPEDNFGCFFTSK